jgi:Putative metal-binding motif
MKTFKSILLISFSMLFIFSCVKDQLNDYASNSTGNSNQALTHGQNTSAEKAGGNAKVALCHYDATNGTWHVINVSQNAVPAHLAHGDVILIDADGDGWVAAENECVPGGDCDDNNAAVNPGAEEICSDEIDNNCDGQESEGCCPLYTYAEISAISGQITCNFLPCCGDQWGFCWSGGCNFGVDADEFYGASPNCTYIFSLTPQETSACKAIILQVADDLGIPYLKPGESGDKASNNGNEGLNIPAQK